MTPSYKKVLLKLVAIVVAIVVVVGVLTFSVIPLDSSRKGEGQP
jgi:hypothetical protein